ncbi:MAG: hypothetical protein QGG67_03455 [Gammaproteobacteria bacterium]|nr:hypothetical protein [Gammaproteobacteria bacterium]
MEKTSRGDCANERSRSRDPKAPSSTKARKKTGKSWLNFGNRAHNLFQTYLRLSMLRSKLSPVDHIVLFAGANEFANPRVFPCTPHVSGANLEFGQQFQLHNKRYLVKESTNLTIPSEWFEGLYYMGKGTVDDLPYYETLIDNTLMNFSSLAQDLDAKLTFVFQPVFSWLDKEPSLEERQLHNFLDGPGTIFHLAKMLWARENSYWFRELTRRRCEELGIHFFDINDTFGSNNLDGEWIFIDHFHLTNLGNEKVAEMIYSNLESQ